MSSTNEKFIIIELKHGPKHKLITPFNRLVDSEKIWARLSKNDIPTELVYFYSNIDLSTEPNFQLPYSKEYNSTPAMRKGLILKGVYGNVTLTLTYLAALLQYLHYFFLLTGSIEEANQKMKKRLSKPPRRIESTKSSETELAEKVKRKVVSEAREKKTKTTSAQEEGNE